MVTIEIDNGSGFCFGVTTAIRKAEEELKASGSLFCLGDIVHNSNEVERLKGVGLVTITHDHLRNLHGVKVLLRAHGEPPSTYDVARQNSIEIIDATCPVVLKLQQRIKQTFVDRPDSQIVIYGKIGHAEVNGLVGQTAGQAIVVEGIDQLYKIDFNRDIALYSQTTKSIEGFLQIIEAIEKRRNPACRFEHNDTICRQVANRVEHIRAFACAHEVVVFVAGEKSSNGKILFNHCANANPRSFFVSSEEQIQPHWIKNASSIGICGATSTPRWLMENVKAKLEKILNLCEGL